LRLLLDENVSPSAVAPLARSGHDVYHIRDRGLIAAPDHVIWRRAIEESRVMVTINAHDFVRLARREELHGGLITFPSGATANQQVELILRAIEAFEAEGRDPMNSWLDIGEDGQIRIADLPGRL
jgi:predicted nuclease of predicted toxin-antitoxin system